MIWSRLFAIVLVAAAVLWIGSGVLGRTEEIAAVETETAPTPRFRVAVIVAKVEDHARATVLSGRTEADDRATAMTRTAGTIEELKVRRGAVVKQGDVLALLSDEAREAQVLQAKSLVLQRTTDLEAKLQLIKRGVIAANEKNQLEADLSAAVAALAQAEAESDRGQVRAPISGVISDVPVTTGQALQLGGMVAQIVALDPMLAVVEVAERQLSGLQVGDRAAVRLVTGDSAEGTVRFISPTASEGTRTYRVDIEIPNKDLRISDGVTAEVTFKLAAAPAVRVPRSALTFSSEGVLSVRVVDEKDVVASVPITIVEDGSDDLWVSGPADGSRVIVQGQDFVNEGQVVEAVPAGTVPAVAARS